MICSQQAAAEVDSRIGPFGRLPKIKDLNWKCW